jgi:branched-chain amino acid transport system permease protein
MIEAYFIHLLILIGIYLILGISLQLSLGYGGLLNLGHIAFFGIGAYSFALLSLQDFPFVLSIIVASVISAFFGWLLSIPTNKLKGDYLALVTLGFSFVIYAILLNWTSVTGGAFGLANIPRPNFLSDNFSFLVIVYSIALVAYLFISRVCGSRFGKVIEAIRDDELAVKSLGKNTFKIKSFALLISAFFAGLAGSLFASYITFIDPSSFTTLIPILLIVIIGGLASLPGTVLATILVILIPEPLRFLGLSSSVIGPLQQILYAMLLLAIIYYRPRGFYGKLDLE